MKESFGTGCIGECSSEHTTQIRVWQYQFNSLWPSDAILASSGSTLAHVMLVAWRHQAITWTNVHLIWTSFCGILLRAISQEMLKISVPKMNLKITILKLFPHLPGASEWHYFTSKSPCTRFRICCGFVLLRQAVHHVWDALPENVPYRLIGIMTSRLWWSIKLNAFESWFKITAQMFFIKRFRSWHPLCNIPPNL